MEQPSPRQLAERWFTIHAAAGDAVKWVETTRTNAPRLDNEADHLILKLRRLRNVARRLGGISARPVTVGFFGLSQAGKSYLISALAAGSNGKLETVYGGRRLDFLVHVNPPGGGAEATGLVTRFSRTARHGPMEYPIELKLFSEVEVGKILANSFFNDFDSEKFPYEYSDAKVRQMLEALARRRMSGPVPGVDKDDVVALWDYLQERFPGSLKHLNVHYWPTAVELAPHLGNADRATLFSVLWGEVPELTATYAQFAQTLERLGHPDTAFAPLQALTTPTRGGGLSQADSIMNVTILERLGRGADKPIRVCPEVDGELRAPVEVTLAQLAALTVEMVFPLVEPTAEPVFEQVDLLDFPGYRGRLDVTSLDDVRRAVKSDDANPLSELILRGKVAYLFERYTDSQEMNVLVVCTPSNKQSDVTSVGPALTEWIYKTQGETADVRGRRKPALLWAVTMFDMRIGTALKVGEDLLKLGWGSGGMMKLVMLERFGRYPWMQEWLPGKAFDNTFLVRKPRMNASFLVEENDEELAVASAHADQLALMKRTFCEDETVAEHVHEPAAAWDAMLTLNDGGLGRMAAYLQEVTQQRIKTERIHEQMDELTGDLIENRLGLWFQAEGAGEVDRKKKATQQIVDAVKSRAVLIGELMHRLELPVDTLRALYLGVGDEIDSEQPVRGSRETTGAAALNLSSDLFSLGHDLDLFGSPAAAPEPAKAKRPDFSSSSDARFAQAVLREWINHLRSVPEDQRLLSFLGFSKPAIEALVDELVTASTRLGLQERLLQAIASTEQSSSKRERLVERQVLNARLVIADFIAWLGYIEMPIQERPESAAIRGARLFNPPPAIEEKQQPVLPPQAINHTGIYLFDWLVGFSKMAIGNAGHSAGREITPEQNDDLGAIIETFNSIRTT